MGFAEVEEHCKDCTKTEHWCWNKRYNLLPGKITKSRRTKSRGPMGTIKSWQGGSGLCHKAASGEATTDKDSDLLQKVFEKEDWLGLPYFWSLQ